MSETKTILVTGGAKRVGRHVALHFAKLGYDVAVTVNTSDPASLRGEVEAVGRSFLSVRADFAQPVEATEAVGNVVERHGRLDVLVHNASVYEPCRLADVTPEVLRRDLAVHVETPLLLTRRLQPLLSTARGTVVAMTDVDLDRSRPSFLTYQLSKAALANLMANLARELAPEVTVNCVAPGAVEWPPEMKQEAKDMYLSRVPLDRVGSPADVAKAIEYLVTSGRYVTGQTLRLDGGRHLV